MLRGLCYDPTTQSIFVSDSNLVRRIDRYGYVATYAGGGDDFDGPLDGLGAEASFGVTRGRHISHKHVFSLRRG